MIFIQHVNVISDHFASFPNRNVAVVDKTMHQVITYRPFKKFDESKFLDDISLVAWKILQKFDMVDDIILVWNSLF